VPVVASSVEKDARSTSSQCHLGRGTRAHILGLAVAPYMRRQNCLVTLVDANTNGLSDEVVRERPAAEAVRREQGPEAGHIREVCHGPSYVEVISPACELNTRPS
jgi:hypothetical protein